ncbi:heterokaryon incompatibility protein-domain-containing protein [Hypoxylon fuscum]|nr:heterokaryon incompatibility protein-domain-containing protein [Hypoxylon fuscum]
MPNETIARDISAAREENRKDQGQKWFRECSSTHDCDQHRDTKFRPTRLVEVVWGSRNSPQWRIVQANECPEVHQHEYATLSHRWPSQGMVSLVQDNLLSFKLPQAQEKLPDRWQQALDMARVLQLRYIWIDSLCIIQDSVEDWRRESLTMNKIYKNSTLTFLLTTPPYETLPLVNTPYSARFMRCFIQLDLMRWLEDVPSATNTMASTHTSQASRNLMTELECPGVNFLVLNRSETSRRGWIFQERLLSNRILHMDLGQWYWQCNIMCEPEGNPNLSAANSRNLIKMANKILKDGVVEHTSLWGRNDAWQNMVEGYSTTLLTFEKDKLIAIAGVAKEFQHDLLGEYCAGLWRNSILSDLTWQCHRTSFRPLDMPASEKAHHAPSWSWASVKKSVYFGSRILYESESELLNSNDRMLELVDIHNVATTPLAEDPFGEIIGGQIELSGWLLRQRSHSNPETAEFGNHSSEEFIFPLIPSDSGAQNNDVPDQIYLFDSNIPYSDEVTASFDKGVPPPEEVYLLPLYWVSSWNEEDPSVPTVINISGDKYQDQNEDPESGSNLADEPDENSYRWIYLLALLLTPVKQEASAENASDTSMPCYERVGALNDWIEPSTDFGTAITTALEITWDPVERQAKPGTERKKTRICIV